MRYHMLLLLLLCKTMLWIPITHCCLDEYGHGDELENESFMLGVRSFFEHLSLDNYLYSRCYSYPHSTCERPLV